MDVDINIYASEAAIPQIAHTSNSVWIRVPPFRYLGCVLQCAVFSHSPVHHTLGSLSPFVDFFSINLAPNCSWNMVNKRRFFSSSEAKSRKNEPAVGRLHRPPLTSRGGGRGRSLSALVGSSVLAYDTASTYWTYCTGWSYQGTALQNERWNRNLPGLKYTWYTYTRYTIIHSAGVMREGLAFTVVSISVWYVQHGSFSPSLFYTFRTYMRRPGCYPGA